MKGQKLQYLEEIPVGWDKSAPRSAADFGWEAHGIQWKFRGNLNVALTFPGLSTVTKGTEITLSQKVEFLYVTYNL